MLMLRRASTVALTSRTARALSFALYGLYHFVSRTLPWREISRTKWIIARRRTRALREERGAAVSGMAAADFLRQNFVGAAGVLSGCTG